MSKYYNAEDVLAIFSEEERPLNWTDSEAEIQADNDFDYYKGMIESLPTIEVSEDCISRQQAIDTVYKAYTRDDAMNEIYALPPVAPSVVPKDNGFKDGQKDMLMFLLEGMKNALEQAREERTEE